MPNYTTDKTVTWAVDNEEIATISQDGTLTPVKNGTVTIKATAKDGSGEFGAKTVNVTAYAKINSLKYNGSSLDIIPDKYEYIIYVKNDVSSISITSTFAGGTLKLNGDGIWISGRTRDIDLTDTETTILLNRDNVTDMTDNVYTIKVIKFVGTQTTASADGKVFTIKPINIENGNTVILALYDDNGFVEMQSATSSGNDIQFTTDKAYTNAKVMVWNSLNEMTPICEAETVK